MKFLRTIIVDDEAAAIRTLSGILREFCPQVEVLKTCDNIPDALQNIQCYQPDLVFLDIEMPPFGLGFDLLSAFPVPSFAVIFTTAHRNYAVQAINEVQPLGYLVKPLRVNAIIEAVEIVQQHLRNTMATTSELPPQLLFQHPRKGKVLIAIPDIIYCKADHRIIDLYYLTSMKTVERAITTRSLKSLAQQLTPHGFCRTHHSFLVNLQHLLHYKREGRSGIIQLPQDHTALVSVLKRQTFEERLAAWTNLQ